MRFKARLRDEDLPELAEDIELLACLAYPGTSQSMLDLLAKDQTKSCAFQQIVEIPWRESPSLVDHH